MEMSRLGDFEVIKTLLARMIYEKSEKELLIRLLTRKGIPDEDVDEVININYEALIDLEPRDEIGRMLSLGNDGLDEDRLYASVRALFIHYLTRYSFMAYLKIRKDRHIDPSPVLDDNAGIFPVFNNDHELREFLTGLYPRMTVDIDGFMRNEKRAVEKFYHDLFEGAGLDERERKFALFRLKDPEARQGDFDRTLSDATITRAKQAALDKILKFLMTGAAAIGQAHLGGKGNG
jgi:hypothetical protein